MKKILIIGTGWEQIPLVKKAKQYGLYVIAAAWWDKKQIPADKIYEVDSRNLEELDKIICTEKPDYIIADESDSAMYAVAFFSEKYQFYGPRLRTQTITNNKFLQRECIKKTSVLQPAYRLCWNLEMAREFANDIEYPIIIKPLDNCGSIGISKVYKDCELNTAWLKAVENSNSRMCIVEKCICGDVITADGFCDSDGFEFIAASNKDMYTENENVAKALYYPGTFSSSMLEQIKEAAELTAEAAEITFGFAHIEFILEKGSNDIYFIEAANRGGGVFISNIILEEITGIDYCGALLRLAMGQKTYAKCRQQYIKKAMLYFLESPKTDSVFDSFTETFPPECQIIHLNKKNDVVNVKNEASAGRHGVAVLTGDNFEDLSQIGKHLEMKLASYSQEYFWMNMNVSKSDSCNNISGETMNKTEIYKTIYEETLTRYQTRYFQLGVSPKTLGWGKTSDQLERFTALTDNYTFHEKTILDIGCGFADFYGFLKDKGILCNYIGVDIIPEFLACAKEKFPEAEFIQANFMLESSQLPKADVVITNGTLNFKQKLIRNMEYTQDFMKLACEKANEAVIMDFLSTCLTKDYPKEEQVFYHDPLEILKMAFQYTHDVKLIHNYKAIPQKEFICMLYFNQ